MEGKKSFDTRGTRRFKSGNSSRTVMLELIREYEWNFKRGGLGSIQDKGTYSTAEFQRNVFPSR